MLPKSPSGRLDLILQPLYEEVFEPDAAPDSPLVRFIAYGDRHRVFGWVRLRASRLTDLMNAHPELHLSGVEIESFDEGIRQPIEDITIHRGQLVAVHAAGPRGDSGLRQDTQTHPVALQSGNYLIGGRVHVDPGTDPIGSITERPAMLPLTDAWIEYWSGEDLKHRSTGTIIVNREHADWIRVVTDEELAGSRLRLRA